MRSRESNPDGSFGGGRTMGSYRALLHGMVAGLRGPLVVISFWSAIALPGLYVPLLFHGIEGPETLGLFFGLFGLHVLALVGGNRHRRNSGA